MKGLRRRIAPAAALFIALGLISNPATAHPLGNFTINHLSVLRAGVGRLDVHYVIDEAEIPSFTALRAQSADGHATPIALQNIDRELRATVPTLLTIDLDGARLPLALRNSQLSTRPGAGNLVTLYWTGDLTVTDPRVKPGAQLVYHDGTFPERIGWKDVVAAPATEPTHELQRYPNSLLGSPRDVIDLSFKVGQTSAPAGSRGGDARASAGRSNQLSDLFAKGTSDWRIVLGTFALAVVLGGLHALEPGHGKTLLAVSLVGARATPKQALILATSLTFAHTIAVILLGVVLLLGSRYFIAESIYPWITLVSGSFVAVIGARAISSFINRRQHAASHAGHVHDGPAGHSHDGISDDEHARLHAQAFEGATDFRGAVLAAMSGGIAPCPAALVVLLTAVTLHQVAYGLAIIVAFSLGLAGVLTGLGIAVVRGAAWLSQRPEFERVVMYGPLVSAVVIASIGSIMVGQGFSQNGVAVPEAVVIALALVATLSYGFWGHSHAPQPATGVRST